MPPAPVVAVQLPGSGIPNVRYVRIQRVNLQSVPVDVGAVVILSPAGVRLLPVATVALPGLDLVSSASQQFVTTAATTASLTLDLGAPAVVGLIRVVPRSPCTAACAADRFRGCQVQILDASGTTVLWATDLAGTTTWDFAVSPAPPVATVVSGRRVRIKRVSAICDWLDVGALLVYGSAGQRLTPTGALWWPMDLTSPPGMWSNMADDDARNSASTGNGTMNYVMLDFGTTVAIDTIRVLARVCGAPNDLGCRDRLRDCPVQILDDAGWTVWSADLGSPPAMAQTFTVRPMPVGTPVRARYLRVQRCVPPADTVDVGALVAYDATGHRLTPTDGSQVPPVASTIRTWRNLTIPYLLVPAEAAPSVDAYVQLDYGGLVTVASVRVVSNHETATFQAALDRLAGCKVVLLDSSGAVVWSASMPGVATRTDTLFTVA